MRSLLCVLSAGAGIALAACGGRVIVDGFEPGAGGQGGATNGSTGSFTTTNGSTGSFTTSGSTGSFSAGQVAVSSTGSSSSPPVAASTGAFASTGSFTTGTGGTGGGPCATCAEVLTGLASPAQLCPKSAALFGEIAKCACATICASVCGDNICLGGPTTPECAGCLSNTSKGCGFELNNCANDV